MTCPTRFNGFAKRGGDVVVVVVSADPMSGVVTQLCFLFVNVRSENTFVEILIS